MTIVELPDKEEGWSCVIVNGIMASMHYGKAELRLYGKHWDVYIKNDELTNCYVMADAIRRK